MNEKVEEKFRAAHSAGDVDAMTTTVVEGYGPEIYGFLVTAHGSMADADDVFSSFCEALWRSFDTFELRCSARTWAYRLARAASVNHHRAEVRRAEQPLATSNRLMEVVARIRSETASYLKSERKTALQRLRDELDDESRTLLVLRLDRALKWKDLALVFLESQSAVPSDEDIEREAARLRKRFQAIKKRLRELGRERGLLV